VIVRISRSRYPVKREAELFRLIEPLIDGRSRPAGLLDLIAARRPVRVGMVERLVISMWADPDDIEQGTSPVWDVATPVDADPDELDTSIDQFDVEADDWPEFVELAKTRARRLS
jgi:hypothetical protein